MNSTAQHQSVRSATIWTIPPGIAIAYFCPAGVGPGEFLFYCLPILAAYWFLSFKTSQLIMQWESQPEVSSNDIHATALRFKYYFSVSLLIPVIIFTAQVPASTEVLSASGIHDVKQGQVMIWGLRNFLALGLTTVISIFFYRRLKDKLNSDLNRQEDEPNKDIENHQDK